MKTQPLKRLFRLWTVLLLVAPSLLIMTIYTVNQITVAKQQSLELISQRVAFQEQVINYWLEERAGNIRRLSQGEAFQTSDEQLMKRALEFRQEGDNNFDSLSYIDKEGYFRVSTLNGGIRYPSSSGQPYFETARAGKEYISDVVIGRNSGLPIINLSCPIYDHTGNFQGLILGSVKTATLQALLHKSWIGKTGGIILVNRHGTLLTAPRLLNMPMDKELAEADVLKLHITDDALRNIRLGESGTASWIDIRGNKVLGAYKDMSERGWTLIGKINEGEVLAPMFKQMELMAGGTGCLVLLIIPLATLLTNRIKRPVDWLLVQSNLVMAEDYEIVGQGKVPANIPNELHTLCEAFIRMSRKIQSSIDLLKTNEDDLKGNVLEIQEANNTLLLRERENKALLDAVPDFFVELSSQGIYLSARGPENKYSIPLEEFLGKSVFEILPPQLAQMFLDEVQMAIRTKSLRAFEYDITIDNEIFMREARVVSYKDNEAMVVIHDVTEQKRATQKIVEIGRQLEQGQRIASLGIMATSIAHEINQPLNAIIVSASGVTYAHDNGVSYSKADMVREFKHIAEQADRIDTIVKNIRMLVRNDYSNRQPVGLKSTIELAVRATYSQIAVQGISIKMRIEETLPFIIANDVHLQQVITNLILNAIQSLSLSTKETKVIEIDAWVEDNVILEICDNGKGIQEAAISNIFEPFVTEKTFAQNTGLGLAIVQTLINAYGGKVIAYNNPSGGATFRIEFPNMPAQAID